MDNIWTIQVNSDPAVTMSSLNLHSAQLQEVKLAPDVFNFTQTGLYDADVAFAYGDEVTVYRDGAQFFKGTCMSPQRRGTGNSERINYRIVGPWWQLEQIIYQQEFARYVGGVATTASLAKLILGTDSSGSRLDSGQVISAVIAYALSQLGVNAQFSLGTVEASTEMPYEELNALSCAEVIKRVLRWNPDITAFFDYSQTVPELSFIKRSSLASRTFALANNVTIGEHSINPRNDLKRDGVVIQYERTDTVDGSEVKNIITDSAGVVSDPLKTLYLFFDLQGSSISYIRQDVVTSSIQESSAAWWSKRHPKLNGATEVSVTNASRTAVNDGEQNNGTSYAKELISGSIADWMIGVGVNDQIVKADVTYKTSAGVEKSEPLRMQVRGTNANDQTYTTLGSSSPAEPTPSGLAAAILSSIATLQYEGSIMLTEQDAGSARYIASTVNVSGGRSEWATMNALVYSVTYDLDGGRTTINFGPAKHLGATDLFQLFRNVRTRKGASGAMRTSTSGGANRLPNKSPNSIVADDGVGAGAAADGFWFFFQDGATLFISNESVLSGYNPEDPDNHTDWSLEFAVSGGTFTRVWQQVPDSTLYDGDAYADPADPQTYFRLPIIRDSKRLALGGAYREDVFCDSVKGPIASFVKIG